MLKCEIAAGRGSANRLWTGDAYVYLAAHISAAHAMTVVLNTSSVAARRHSAEAAVCCSQKTISAPHMHAAALELLKDHLQPGASAFDVGSGQPLPAAKLITTPIPPELHAEDCLLSDTSGAPLPCKCLHLIQGQAT